MSVFVIAKERRIVMADKEEKSILEGSIVSAAVLPNEELVEIEKEKSPSPEVLGAYAKKLSELEK